MTYSRKWMNSVTRRHAVQGGLTCLGAGIAALPALAAPDKTGTASLTALRQEADFAASPHRVYESLLDEKQFTSFSGSPAKINRAEGGALSLFGGAITARNVELVADKRIVQAWRDADWAPGIYSIVKFELTPRGAGTHLVMDQTAFPAGQFSDLDPGWREHYWEPMKKFLR